MLRYHLWKSLNYKKSYIVDALATSLNTSRDVKKRVRKALSGKISMNADHNEKGRHRSSFTILFCGGR